MPIIKAISLNNLYMALTAQKTELLLAMYNMSIFMPLQKVLTSLIIFIHSLINLTGMELMSFTPGPISKQKRNA